MWLFVHVAPGMWRYIYNMYEFQTYVVVTFNVRSICALNLHSDVIDLVDRVSVSVRVRVPGYEYECDICIVYQLISLALI